MSRFSNSLLGAALLVACGQPAPVEPAVAAGVVAISGDSQLQVPGTALFAPLVVQLVDANGAPVPVGGQPLVWEIEMGTGSLTVDTDTTTNQGFGLALWTLGPELGAQAVTVTATGLGSVRFEAVARLPGPIVFVSGRSGLLGNEFEGYPGDLYAMDEDGSDVMPLFPPSLGIQYLTDPVWAPNGQSVLFARSTGRPAGGTPGLLHAGIHEIDIASLAVSQVPSAGFPSYVNFYREATWSRDGQQIMAWLDTAIGTQNIPPDISPGQLHVMSAQGLGEDPVPAAVALARSPDWSPVADRIVFVCVPSQDQELCVADPDGGNLVQLTTGAAIEDDPRWSPDGTRILFIRDRENDGGVWVINADGSGEVQILPGRLSSPAWSPDGMRFLVTVETATTQDIHLVDVATGQSTNLTASPFRDRDPAWRR